MALKVKNVETRVGCADDPQKGRTVIVNLDNGDIVQIEVIPEDDAIWVQYGVLEDKHLVPESGYLMDLKGRPVMQ